MPHCVATVHTLYLGGKLCAEDLAGECLSCCLLLQHHSQISKKLFSQLLLMSARLTIYLWLQSTKVYLVLRILTSFWLALDFFVVQAIQQQSQELMTVLLDARLQKLPFIGIAFYFWFSMAISSVGKAVAIVKEEQNLNWTSSIQHNPTKLWVEEGFTSFSILVAHE